MGDNQFSKIKSGFLPSAPQNRFSFCGTDKKKKQKEPKTEISPEVRHSPGTSGWSPNFKNRDIDWHPEKITKPVWALRPYLESSYGAYGGERRHFFKLESGFFRQQKNLNFGIGLQYLATSEANLPLFINKTMVSPFQPEALHMIGAVASLALTHNNDRSLPWNFRFFNELRFSLGFGGAFSRYVSELQQPALYVNLALGLNLFTLPFGKHRLTLFTHLDFNLPLNKNATPVEMGIPSFGLGLKYDFLPDSYANTASLGEVLAESTFQVFATSSSPYFLMDAGLRHNKKNSWLGFGGGMSIGYQPRNTNQYPEEIVLTPSSYQRLKALNTRLQDRTSFRSISGFGSDLSGILRDTVDAFQTLQLNPDLLSKPRELNLHHSLFIGLYGRLHLWNRIHGMPKQGFYFFPNADLTVRLMFAISESRQAFSFRTDPDLLQRRGRFQFELGLIPLTYLLSNGWRVGAKVVVGAYLDWLLFGGPYDYSPLIGGGLSIEKTF